MIRGSCACGGIRFQIEAVRSLTHCHCTTCRKLTGASFATYAHVEKAQFHWLARRGIDQPLRIGSWQFPCALPSLRLFGPRAGPLSRDDERAGRLAR